MGLDIDRIEDLGDDADALIYELVSEGTPPPEGLRKLVDLYRDAGDDPLWDSLLDVDFEADLKDMTEMVHSLFSEGAFEEKERGVNFFINEPFLEVDDPLHAEFGESTFFLNSIGFTDLEKGGRDPVVMASEVLTSIHSKTVGEEGELWSLGHFLSLGYASVAIAHVLAKADPTLALGGAEERFFVLNFADNVHPLGWMTRDGWTAQCSLAQLEEHAESLESADAEARLRAIQALGRSGYVAYDYQDSLQEVAQAGDPTLAKAAKEALVFIEAEIERCGG